MNPAEFARCYRQLYMPLGMYALRMLGDVAASEDVVQSAFADTWSHLQSGAQISDLKAYLYRVVHNAALAEIESSGRMMPADKICADREVDSDDIDTSERDAALWRAIDNLPPRCRTIFLMSKRDGCSHAEIASELGISIKTVENQITKAFTSLRADRRLLTGNIFFLPFL